MPKSEIILIAAVGERSRVIGNGLKLPWHIPEDLKRFKALTKGYPLIMGRRTYESLIDQFGKPLSGRPHLVLSSNSSLERRDDVTVYSSIADAVQSAQTYDKIFIAGGAGVYEQCLELADRWELTIVEGEYEGDVFFPPYEHMIGLSHELTSCENRDRFRFETYSRSRDR